jgi:hypothetical protein
VLVVEVSRTTQEIDREKATVHARAGVPEAYSRAASDCYTLVRVLAESDVIDVPGASERWTVRDLLPPVP